jgi:hypothetical protein
MRPGGGESKPGTAAAEIDSSKKTKAAERTRASDDLTRENQQWQGKNTKQRGPKTGAERGNEKYRRAAAEKSTRAEIWRGRTKKLGGRPRRTKSETGPGEENQDARTEDKKNLRAAAARTGEQPDLSEKKNGVQLRTRTAHR